MKHLHDLQVQRIELEMQNDELRKTRAELQVSLDRFTALYECAPVGLLTLDPNGAITECNLATADLLRIDQTKLLQGRLNGFVVSASFQAFHTSLYAVFHGERSRQCEVKLLRPDGSRLVVQMTLVRRHSAPTCVAALTDITEGYELLEQSRTLARRMFELLESDRHNIATEIHDDLAPWLNSTYAATAAMLRAEHKLEPETRRNIRTVIANAAEMQNVLRQVLLKLRPTMLDTVGLGETLHELVDQWCERHKGIACGLSQHEVEGLDETVNITLFRIVQEALANVAKHAGATRVDIHLDRIRDAEQPTPPPVVMLTIHDDGRGFDTSQPSLGLGLLGMRERTIAVGGCFSVSSGAGQGTTVTARVPCRVTSALP